MGTPADDCISARIGELKAAQTAADAATRKRADEEALAKAEAERQRLALLQQEEERKRVEAAKHATEAAAKKKADDEARAKAEAERQRLALLEQQRQDEARKAAEAWASRRRSDAASATAPGSVFRDCPDCPEMVVVPAGSFMMGSPA